jgi:hypothetical protein
MNNWLENVRMMLLSVGLILGVYVQQRTGEYTHCSRLDNRPVFRWLLESEGTEIRLDTKTIGPLDVLTGTPPPTSCDQTVDLSEGQTEGTARDLAQATTPTVPTRQSARFNHSPVPTTPQSAPKELTNAQMQAFIEPAWIAWQYRIDNKLDTKVKARLDERIAPQLLKLTKAAEATNKKFAQDLSTTNKRLKELEKEMVALRKVRVYGNITSPSNNGKFPAELLPNGTGAGLCIVYNLSHRLT